MKKIPTLFQRDPDDRRHLLPIVTPGCEWVVVGEGVATRKYDGTCVGLDELGDWWARREVKPGKADPPGFRLLGVDETTGKRMGWEPIEQSGFYRWFAEAVNRIGYDPIEPGTYELCGPKINGNPEDYPHHVLRAHDHAELLHLDAAPIPGDAEAVYRWFAAAAPEATLHGRRFEGIVWHHPDGRMVKLKWKDFPA